MSNTNGYTQQDVFTFGQIVTKANDYQIEAMKHYLIAEQEKRKHTGKCDECGEETKTYQLQNGFYCSECIQQEKEYAEYERQFR